MDKGGVPHPVNSVELYLPWNNTWLDLPPLPDLGNKHGRMDRTNIMSLTDGGGSHLYLLGGYSTDLTTGMTATTGTVWRLMGVGPKSQSYAWTSSFDPALGR